MSLEQVGLEIKEMTDKELIERYKLYSDLQSVGLRDLMMLGLLENEMLKRGLED